MEEYQMKEIMNDLGTFNESKQGETELKRNYPTWAVATNTVLCETLPFE